MGSILSIDYGTKRIGLAISDPSRNFAFPCGVIQNKGLKYVLFCISDIVTQKEIDLILVGVPYDHRTKKASKGKESMEETVCKFIEQLKKEIKVPIETIDESLSSFAAEEKLKETMSSKDLKKFVDQEAARLLLEEFIQKAKS